MSWIAYLIDGAGFLIGIHSGNVVYLLSILLVLIDPNTPDHLFSYLSARHGMTGVSDIHRHNPLMTS